MFFKNHSGGLNLPTSAYCLIPWAPLQLGMGAASGEEMTWPTRSARLGPLIGHGSLGFPAQALLALPGCGVGGGGALFWRVRRTGEGRAEDLGSKSREESYTPQLAPKHVMGGSRARALGTPRNHVQGKLEDG